MGGISGYGWQEVQVQVHVPWCQVNGWALVPVRFHAHPISAQGSMTLHGKFKNLSKQQQQKTTLTGQERLQKKMKSFFSCFLNKSTTFSFTLGPRDYVVNPAWTQGRTVRLETGCKGLTAVEFSFYFVDQGWQVFPVKDQMVIILGFTGHMGTVATTQSCLRKQP